VIYLELSEVPTTRGVDLYWINADVLQLASNFTTFFEKLAGTLEQIGRALPEYRFLLNILHGMYANNRNKVKPLSQIRTAQSFSLSVRIEMSICTLYKDILRFLLAVIRVFTKKDGCEYTMRAFKSHILTSLKKPRNPQLRFSLTCFGDHMTFASRSS
jgi:hypothetical protein